MAFSFSQTGTKEALANALDAIKADAATSFASYRQGVIDDLGKLPAKFNGAHVDIVFRDHAEARTFQVNIIGKTLAV